MTIKLSAFSATHPGKVRSKNEDAVYHYVSPPGFDPPKGFVIVADGVGGHQGGEIASKITVDTVFDSLRSFLEKYESRDARPLPIKSSSLSESTIINHFSLLEPKIRNAIAQANSSIYEYSIKEYGIETDGMGSTITCAMVYNLQAVIANVGDSRTYLLRKGVLKQITEDHSYVAELVKHNFITPDSIYTHPHRNVITRSLGYSEEVEIDVYSVFLEPGDKLLLCSDGLWEMVISEDEIKKIIETEKIKNGVKKLIQKANDYGGKDNIGIAVLEVLG
ncbi:MAG: Stp1/IreP family PP2C-type Ser/Thr phosphatase [Anaerolineales bacterium]|nr:Stp1/IreP family PP2C-type Ser/Thr phosphatase [Anaerolineales bacterium]